MTLGAKRREDFSRGHTCVGWAGRVCARPGPMAARSPTAAVTSQLQLEKLKGEALGVVVVESGWGSILPTVILANMMNSGPAARSGKLSIGDQIMSVNGTSLVGLPLATCQGLIKVGPSPLCSALHHESQRRPWGTHWVSLSEGWGPAGVWQPTVLVCLGHSQGSPHGFARQSSARRHSEGLTCEPAALGPVKGSAERVQASGPGALAPGRSWSQGGRGVGQVALEHRARQAPCWGPTVVPNPLWPWCQSLAP